MSIVSPLAITWMFLMRKRTFFNRFAFAAVIAGSFTVAGQLQAKNDFEALLADVDFGGISAVQDATVPSASDSIGLPSEASELASTPTAQTHAAQSLAMPEAAPEPLPEPPGAAAPTADYNVSAAAGCSDCGQCESQCGCNSRGLCGLKKHDFLKDQFCQPYTPPQVPTSTFYQYWRSNACNVHVWDGYKNRCHARVDLSIHPKHSSGCGGCASGACNNLHPAGVVDCGPAPAEWCGKAAAPCDACDAQ